MKNQKEKSIQSQEGYQNTLFDSLSTHHHNPSHKFIQNPTTLSLFSGAGGLDIGFHKAGFRIIACIEIDKHACETLRLNVGRYLDPSCQILEGDIREIEIEKIIQEEIDFIIGGPPCQSFSAIGRRAGGAKGRHDDRGSLFEEYCRIVKHYQPSGFLFENVRGILSSHKGEDWKLILSSFTELGYQISYRVLSCADYGVPQHRERLIMVGTKNENICFPRPIYGADSKNQQPYVTALQAIEDLQNPDEPNHSYGGKYGDLLSEVPPGMNYHYFTREMGYPTPKFAWRSRFSDFLYKADPYKPVRTIVANLGAYSGPFHWKNRKFTIQEFMRLQTFPDDYQFAGGTNATLRQIGNSVPPQFAEYLAKTVKQQLFGASFGLETLSPTANLTFDSRKRKKAQATRSKRVKKEKEKNTSQLNLFTPQNKTYSESNAIYEKSTYFDYHTLKNRSIVTNIHTDIQGLRYKFLVRKHGSNCFIDVSRFVKNKFSEHCILKYSLDFHHIIGDDVQAIQCNLFSDSMEDIPIVWDAIEDCINLFSGYSTMMDVYGHFTEPHPIFNLKLDTYINSNDFILNFIKKFSDFNICSKLLPATVLEEIYANSNNDVFNLSNLVLYLRKLRFDIRVHETNTTIPIGYFRCCYPFTTNINKQISVSWKG